MVVDCDVSLGSDPSAHKPPWLPAERPVKLRSILHLQETSYLVPWNQGAIKGFFGLKQHYMGNGYHSLPNLIRTWTYRLLVRADYGFYDHNPDRAKFMVWDAGWGFSSANLKASLIVAMSKMTRMRLVH